MANSAQDVFDALTNPQKVEMWTRAKADISAKVGAPFSYFDGNITGEILECVREPLTSSPLSTTCNPTQPNGNTGAREDAEEEVAAEGVAGGTLLGGESGADPGRLVHRGGPLSARCPGRPLPPHSRELEQVLLEPAQGRLWLGHPELTLVLFYLSQSQPKRSMKKVQCLFSPFYFILFFSFFFFFFFFFFLLFLRRDRGGMMSQGRWIRGVVL